MMNFEVYEVSDIENPESYFQQVEPWSDLWWADFEEAGVVKCYLAFDDTDKVVGFQTTNADNLCVAIEVHPDFRGKGIAAAIIDESNCYRAEDNRSPIFWSEMESRHE
jgi:GNAT superfamily N-acetyltransferase